MKFAGLFRILCIANAVWLLAANTSYADGSALDKKMVFFDLDSGSLPEIIVEFALQSKTDVVVNQALLKDKSGKALLGRYSITRALEILLRDTNLDFSVEDEGKTIFISERKPLGEAIANDVQPVVVDNDYEEVIVSGIRGSLLRGLEQKYQAQDILEALSEEEIGKFPDTNLAEALQRLSGVTISYENNEGSKVNVRGFDANFNLVLINGRQMPTADLKDGLAAGSRAFNFADIAAENIAAVDVHKTSTANLPTGGIGSIINIKTSRPLEIDDATYSFGVKSVKDTSQAAGEGTVTPEISGLASRRFFEDTVGVLVSGSFQARDSRSESVNMEWSKTLSFAEQYAELSDLFDPDVEIWYPFNQTISIADHERERINAQVVFQYEPNDLMLLTLDYTFSQVDQYVERSEFEMVASRRLDIDQPIELIGQTVSRATEIGGTYAFLSSIENTRNKNDSFGINLQIFPADEFTIAMDAHHSVSRLIPLGRGNQALIRKDAPNVASQTFDASFEIPEVSYVFSVDPVVDGEPETFRDNVEIIDFIYQNQGATTWSTLESQVDHIKIDLSWEPMNTSFITGIRSGVSHGIHKTKAQRGVTRFIDPFAGRTDIIIDPDTQEEVIRDEYDTSIYQARNGAGLLDEFTGGFSNTTDYYTFSVDALAEELDARLGALDPNEWISPSCIECSIDWANFRGAPGAYDSNSEITETSSSIYTEFLFGKDFSIHTIDVVAGVRYERTSFESSSLQYVPTNLTWLGPDNYRFTLSQEPVEVLRDSEYDATLPSLSIRSEWFDSFVFRASASTSIARFDMDLISSELILETSPQSEQGIAYEGGRATLPYLSDNFDVSFEWYYGEGNGLSLALFKKDVEGFPAATESERNLFGLRNVAYGDRANAIRDELIANGEEPSEENVFNLMQERYPPENPEVGITPDETDPLYSWRVFSVANEDSVEIEGFEISLQQMFGSSGFGTMANLTHVESSANFEFGAATIDSSVPTSGEFLNLIGFYENAQWQARVAYHWNDEYPSFANSISGVVPIYTEAYGQFDALISYRWDDRYVISFEGINITNETQRLYNGESERLYRAQQFGPRYQIGFRANF